MADRAVNEQALSSGIVALAAVAERLHRPDIQDALKRLEMKRSRREWCVVLVGETSVGKSALINSLLGRAVLPESARPTTGHVVLVETSAGADRLEGIRTDGTVAELDPESFRAACLGAGDWFALRAAVQARTPLPPGMLLVDTPGYNSCLERHTQILTDYIPNADAVLFLTSHRRGMTQEDAAFLKLVRDALGEAQAERLFCAVNWCPGAEPDARVKSMEASIAGLLDQALPLHTVHAAQRSPLRLEAASLWQAVATHVAQIDPAQALDQSAARVATGFADMLARDLAAQSEAAEASEAHLDQIRDRIRQLRELNRAADRHVETYGERLHRAVTESTGGGIWALQARAEREIDDAGRFTEFNACAAYVRLHLVPTAVEELNQQLQATVEVLCEEMAGALEQVAGQAERLTSPHYFVPQQAPGTAVISDVRNRTVKGGAEVLAAAYLRQLGGAIGQKAGVVNLAKMLLKRWGNLQGKVYSRTIYDTMGKALKRFGITAGRVIGAFSMVVVEAAAYLYHVLTWKGSLKNVVARALTGERSLADDLREAIPFFRDHQEDIRSQMLRGYRQAVDGCLADTRDLVAQDYRERIQVLTRSLEVRAAHGDQARAVVRDRMQELEAAAVQIRSAVATEEGAA